MPTALELAKGNSALTVAVVRCRKLLRRRALVAGAASAIPVPGMDWVVDAAIALAVDSEGDQRSVWPDAPPD